VLGAEEGATAVRLARRAVTETLGGTDRSDPPTRLSPAFERPRGAFVTLKRYPDGLLRGCIGYPMPVLPLRSAIARAAVSAALDDPRFPAVTIAELERLTFEVSVLTVPAPVDGTGPEAIARSIRVGRDGLVVEMDGRSGLLLPQVAPEQGWTAEEFLDGTCEKAGLAAGAWRFPGVRVRRFEAEVFSEREPFGPVAPVRAEARPASERPAPRS